MAYIVHDGATGKFFLVDPADLDAVDEVMQEYGIQGAPEAILTTHKHWDHAGHNDRFAQAYPGIRIISGRNEPVYMATEGVEDATLVNNLLGGAVVLEAFETPCHTAAHNMWILRLDDAGQQADGVNKVIFTGDCLFEGGVGMFFEGNAD